MAVTNETSALNEAVEWLIRQRDPTFADWSEFTSWLEASPANADAYATLSVREEAVAERLTTVACIGAINNLEPTRRTTKWAASLAGLLAVAALFLAVMGVYVITSDPSFYLVTTGRGQQRVVTLADGSTIALNGNSRLKLDREDPRYAALESGEALFSVIHDSDRPFRVQLGEAELVDLGTRFNVLRGGGVTEVGVAEGMVMYNPEREAVRLVPGRRLRVSDRDMTVQLSSIDPEAVGSWTERRLVYDNVPLAVVANDLTRNLGKTVRADASVATRPVTAVVQIPADREQLAPRLEMLLDIKVRRIEDDWILTTKS